MHCTDWKKKLKIAAAGTLAFMMLAGPCAMAASGVTTDRVNVRKNGTVSSAALTVVDEGTMVTILGTDGGWTKVKVNGTTGYIRSDFIRETNASGRITVKKDVRHDDVKVLQRALEKLGLYDGDISGRCGDKTVSAIKAFQRKYGLAADGICGAATWAKILALTEGGSTAPSASSLRKGDSGEAVRQLQRDLKAAGYFAGGVDGEFGPKTETAVKNFQKAMGLTADGIAGKATQAKLTDLLAGSTSTTLRKGSEGSAVKSLQLKLIGLGYLAKGSDDGKFGAKTENAVRAFQRNNGLSADGVAGPATQAKLVSSNAVKASSASGENTDLPEPGSGRQEAPSASGVQLLDWFETVKYTLPKNKDLSIYDVRTGLTYTVRSFSNGNHADVEPVTKEDTAIMLKTYNGKWSWDPRPVWVSYNGITVAASINGMPHASGPNKNNGMDGQVCLHFLNSRTHNGNTAFEKRHQDGVQEAWDAAKK